MAGKVRWIVRESDHGRRLEKVMTDAAGGSGGGGISGGNLSTSSGPSNLTSDNSGTPTENVGGSVTAPPLERQSSRNDEDRLFRFNIDFDSGRRQLQALSRFHEWARNSVNLSIPVLGGSSSTPAPDPEPTSSGAFRDRLAHRSQMNDTQIMMPRSDQGPSFYPSPSHQIPRRSSSEQDSDNGHSGTSGQGNRDALVLDIEAGGSTWEGERGESSRRQSNNTPTSPDGEGAMLYALPPDPADGSPTNAHGDRTPAEILRDTPETRAVINEINRYTTLRPFLIIMLMKGLMDHGSGILCFLAMLCTLSHANSCLKKEVAKQRKRNLLYLGVITTNLVVCAAFIFYVFNEDELYYALIFLPTKVELTSFWLLLWVVGVSDFVGKFASIIAKSFIAALPASVLAFQKRGKYYLFIEQTTQLYRSFLPIHHWIIYLSCSYEGATKMFGMFLAGLYCCFKAYDSIQRVKDWNAAFQKLLQNVHYGSTPTAKELDSVGTTCPICHDIFTCPTRLSCTHIFCEECVSTWFDRERTCPMCRAKVVDDPKFRDGSTSQYIQVF